MSNTYEVLNDYLNYFCKDHDSSIFNDYLNEYLKLSSDTLRMLRRKGDIILRKCKSPSLTLEESLDLCDEFVRTYLDSYYNQWKEYLSNGVIDFMDAEHIEFDDDRKKGSWSSFKRKNNQVFRLVDVDLNHDYEDPSIIIHEFLHQLNVNIPDDLANNSGFLTYSRYIFTEAVSIYFETLMFRFMEEKGFSIKEVANAQMFRINDLLRISGVSCDNLILLRDFELFGKISLDNVDKAREYHLISFSNKEDYHNVACDIERKIGGNHDGSDYTKTNYDFFIPFTYVIGTTLAYWAISQDDSNMTWKFIQFNEDLAQDRDLDYVIERFSSNSISIKDLVDGTEKEVSRCTKQIDNSNDKRR